MLAAMQTAPLTNVAEYTVSELSFALKRTVEDAFGLVRLRGEISGFRGVHSSGHVYLSLKDDKAKIDGVIWRGTYSGLRFKPAEGLEVVVTGRLTTFPGKSSYQIIIEQLEPAGVGALMALLEERKKQFAAEGLFDQARKKPVPFWPQVIGIITSPTGAVIRDMLHGFTERCPSRVALWPVRVQGETCAQEVAAAIYGFNALAPGGPVPRPELIIVARGGGSLEDLWGFNEEIVVRAAAASAIPIISAVGHETDWTLIDLVADARAPTPTKAAEWAVPKHADLVMRVADDTHRMRHCIRRHLEKARAEFRGAERGLPRPQALLAGPQQRLDAAAFALSHALRHFSREARLRLDRFGVRLHPGLVHVRVQRCRETFDRWDGRVRGAFFAQLRQSRHRLEDRAARLQPELLAVSLRRNAQTYQRMAERLAPAERRILNLQRQSLDASSKLLRSLSHRSVLERGFALVRREGSRIVSRASQLTKDAAALEIEFADGRISAQYGEARPDKTAAVVGSTPTPKYARRKIGDDDAQGTLL
jgi:exodeoxyribonuclease VII large subunit